jgi:hypothetical protein
MSGILKQFQGPEEENIYPETFLKTYYQANWVMDAFS